MARSRLFATLQRAARIARVARHTGLPLDEAIDRIQEVRTDAARRHFLSQAAGAAATLVVAGCTRNVIVPPVTASGSGSKDEVVIIGAGIAGLTAAWRLQQADVPVRIFEAQNRVGGRMFSLRDYFPDQQVIELGGELIDSNHVRIRAMAAEMGLTLDDLAETDPVIHTELWWADDRAIGEAEIMHKFAPVAAAIDRDLATLGDGDITYDAPQNAQALDAMTVSQWLDRNGVRGWLRKLIEVAYTTEMGLECDQQSALNLITFIGTGKDDFRIFGESDERYHVRGGNDSIPRALAAKLSAHVETGSVLEAISQSANGEFVLSMRQGAASRSVRASQVLLAIPFTTLRQVQIDVPLPASKQRAIRDLRYGTNAKLMIGFNQRIWRDQYHFSGSVYANLPLQTTWETTRKQAGKGGVLVNFVGGAHGVAIGTGSARMQADEATRELDVIFPGIAATRKGAREVRMHWPSFPWTQGSYACFGPGDWTGLRGAMGETVGQLYFAGEHCALDTQGFMEGGCESGETAAQAILAARGVATKQTRVAA